MTDEAAPAPLDRAAVFQALAEGLDLPRVLACFRLTPEQLRELFQEAADLYRERQDGPWTLFVDGAARGNPGPAGAGAVLTDSAGQVRGRISHFLGRATNNVAEYRALLLGLELARQRGVRRLRIFADSQLLVEQLNGRYRVRAPHLKPLYAAARQALAAFQTYSLTHVDRSANQEADRLANQAIDQAGREGYNSTRAEQAR